MGTRMSLDVWGKEKIVLHLLAVKPQIIQPSHFTDYSISCVMFQAAVVTLAPCKLGSIPDQSVWDFWWSVWHWDMFLSEYLGFP